MLKYRAPRREHRSRLPRPGRSQSTGYRRAVEPRTSLGQRTRTPAADVAAGGGTTPSGAGDQRARPLGEDRPCAHLPDRAGGAAAGGAVDQRPALELGAPARPPGRLPRRKRRRATESRHAMSERSIEHAAFVVERVYDASPDRVFAAWSDPQAKARWFDGPEAKFELDFRVGGWERRRGMLPDGREYIFEALYRDIVPGRRIVNTYDMLLDGIRIS